MRSVGTEPEASSTGTTPIDRLFVTWQDPESREVRAVGILCHRRTAAAADRFEFRYLRSARRPPFSPFVNFPELDGVYKSPTLFPMFRNRVMRPDRPDYATYLDELQLPASAAPFEILTASGGIRATDSIEVFQEPTIDQEGRASCRFLARGVRHVQGAAAAIAQLAQGDRLRLVREPDNPVDGRALVIETLAGARLGYVPAYLLDFLYRVESTGHSIEDADVVVENPNSVGPHHLRLLCQLRTAMPPGGFMTGDLRPIVAFDSGDQAC